MLRPLWMIACLVLSACHSRPARNLLTPAPAPPGGPGVEEVWVDGTSPAGGTGSRERPYASPREVLERKAADRPLRVHLAPGRYPGPLVLAAGWEWVGEGAVLVGEGDGPVVSAPGGVWLRGVELHGGAWGLEAGGTVRLESVRFTGQGTGGLRMTAGELSVADGRFEAAAPEAVGLRLEAANARLRETSFQGPFRRAVEMRGGRLEVEGAQVSGARTGFHLAEGEARLTRVAVSGGREVGIFAHHATLRLEDVSLTGYEFGLQTREATLSASRLLASHPLRAGVSLLSTTGLLAHSEVVGSGDFGAVSLLGSNMELRELKVSRAESYGIVATRGRLRLESVSISQVTSREGDAGDGLHLRDVEVEARAVTVRDVAGAGVLAAQGARVALHDVTLLSCRTAGVWSETLAEVTSRQGLRIGASRGPALVAMVNGVMRLEDLTVEDNAGGLLAADCAGDTRVTLGRVRGLAAAPPMGSCVTGPSP